MKATETFVYLKLVETDLLVGCALILWADTTEPPAERPALAGDRDADVAIVGAGYTGLWTAYYLAKADPALRIVVLEARTAGFGASGRNGGWCSALFPVSTRRLASLPGSSREAAIELHRAMQATVNEVGLVSRRRGHRLRLPQGRHDRARPHAGPARPGPRRGGGGP